MKIGFFFKKEKFGTILISDNNGVRSLKCLEFNSPNLFTDSRTEPRETVEMRTYNIFAGSLIF